MKINKPINVQKSNVVGKQQGKSTREATAVGQNASSQAGVKLSGSASFVQTLRDSNITSQIRTEVVAQAQKDINTNTLGSESDYNQAITALFMEL